jgi:hypothetical protein
MKNKDTNFNETSLRNDYVGVINDVDERVREKSYLERNKGKYNRSKFFKKFYPIFSVVSATFLGVMGANVLSNSDKYSVGWWATILLVGSAVFVIADLNEKAKQENLESFFFANVGQRIMMFTVFVSLAFSGFGGYLFNIATNDPTNSINEKFNILNDSVSSQYQNDLNVINAVIAENQKRFNSKSKWTRYHAQKDLDKNLKTKSDILAMSNGQKNELKSEKENEILTANELLKYKGYIYTAIVVIFELLYIYAFFFESQFCVKVSKEKAENYNTVQTAVFDLVKLLEGSSQNLISAGSNGTSQLTVNANNQVIPKKNDTLIGFQFKGERLKAKETDFDAKMPTCQNCGKSYVKKVHHQKFCSDTCRQNNWKTKNKK